MAELFYCKNCDKEFDKYSIQIISSGKNPMYACPDCKYNVVKHSANIVKTNDGWKVSSITSSYTKDKNSLFEEKKPIYR